MRSFFAMIWDTEEARQAGASARIRHNMKLAGLDPQAGIDEAGFMLCDCSEMPDATRILNTQHSGPGPRGAIFGSLFPRLAPPSICRPIHRLEDRQADLIAASGGRTLLSAFWGSYVAFFSTADGFHVLQEPTASIPCYYAEQDGCLLVFSNLERCSFLDRSRFSINWDFVSALLAYDKLLNGETGLNEVRELLAGERLTRAPDGRLCVKPLWDPRDLAVDVLDLPTEDAAEQLALTTHQVVDAHASRFSNIAVSLSGGLDSSIVLGSLVNTGYSGRLTGAHFILGSGDAPETDYARAAADHSGCPLIEIDLPAGTGFPELENCPATTRPMRAYLAPDLPALFSDQDGGAHGAWFTGQGGDHLFLVSRSANVFLDYLRYHGLGPGTASALLDSAHLSGQSVWSILRETLIGSPKHQSAMIAGLRRRATRLNRRHQDRLDPALGLPVWARRQGKLPPAKFDQISILPHLFQLRDPIGSAGPRETVHPLISQPLVELCLRLPAWLLNSGGVSRGLARRAFADTIPDSVRLRLTKGYASRYYGDSVSLHSEEIATALRDGALVNQGLIDPADLEAMLHGERFRTDPSGSMLLVYYGIEAWARTWTRLSAAHTGAQSG